MVITRKNKIKLNIYYYSSRIKIYNNFLLKMIRPKIICTNDKESKKNKIILHEQINTRNNGPTEILSWLFLGNANDTIKQFDNYDKIFSFVNLNINSDKIEYILFEDNETTNIHKIFFNDIFFKILDQKNLGKKILLNCKYGISRSPIVICAYLLLGIMQKTNNIINPFEKILNYIINKRLINNVKVEPNFNFFFWLNNLQNNIKFNTNNSVDINNINYMIEKEIISNNDFVTITSDPMFIEM